MPQNEECECFWGRLYVVSLMFTSTWKQVLSDRLQHISSLAVAVHVNWKKAFYIYFCNLDTSIKIGPCISILPKITFWKGNFLIGFAIGEILSQWKIDIFVQLEGNFSFLWKQANSACTVYNNDSVVSIYQTLNQILLLWSAIKLLNQQRQVVNLNWG